MRAQIYKYLLYTTRKNSFFDKYITYIYITTTFTADAKNFRVYQTNLTRVRRIHVNSKHSSVGMTMTCRASAGGRNMFTNRC